MINPKIITTTDVLLAGLDNYYSELFMQKVMTVSKKDYKRAYNMIYDQAGVLSTSLISSIERKLVQKEIKETGSDKIHWQVWNTVKNRTDIKEALSS